MRKGAVIVPCSHCGKEFKTQGRRIREGRKYCSTACNYLAKKRTAEQTFARFIRKSSDVSACWIWTGAVNQRGYGLMTIRSIPPRRDTAHRFSYKLHKGQIPPGMLVCHTCDNTSCCNPDHLFLGTAIENSADMISKGRQATKLSVEQVLAIRASSAPSRALAREYGTSHTQIRRIRSGESWRHIP